MTEIRVTDLIVKTANPDMLDATVQQLGPAVVVDGSWNGETCRVRAFGDPGYLRFAISSQGYGEIVGEEPIVPVDTENETDALSAPPEETTP